VFKEVPNVDYTKQGQYCYFRGRAYVFHTCSRAWKDDMTEDREQPRFAESFPTLAVGARVCEPLR
jgi:hypothetical protein